MWQSSLIRLSLFAHRFIHVYQQLVCPTNPRNYSYFFSVVNKRNTQMNMNRTKHTYYKNQFQPLLVLLTKGINKSVCACTIHKCSALSSCPEHCMLHPYIQHIYKGNNMEDYNKTVSQDTNHVWLVLLVENCR